MITYSFTKYADSEFRKLPVTIQIRIVKKIKFYIATGKPLHFADTIKGREDKVYRFRIGDYRVIFEWLENNQGHIRILKVRPRPQAY